MPWFKGKRKRGLTLYKKQFQYNVLYQNRSPQAGKRENWQFVDLSRLQFTSDESEFIPDYISTPMMKKYWRYKLKFSFSLLEYCKIRECYAVANAFTIINMYSLFLYMKCNSRKINHPTPEVILTNFFAEPTVLLVSITSREDTVIMTESAIIGKWK
jgi:hypothetical protein